MQKGGDTELGASTKILGGSLFRGISNYPKCKIFICTKAHSGTVKNLCCFYCEKKETCIDPCHNHPDKCKMCVMPVEKEGDSDCGD